MAAERTIQLSIVATSRNDNHGGSLTHRMQHFVDGFVAQCKRHDLRAELILVEWNPPADRVPLAEELHWPKDAGPCEIRIVTVPREVHARISNADKIPLYQMLAKNVGIRRARGRYVLATNIDILFSDQAMIRMRDHLRPGCLYRAERVDVPTDVPKSHDFAEVLAFCEREGFRIHAPAYTVTRRGRTWMPIERWRAQLDPRLVYLGYLLRLPIAFLRLIGVALVSPRKAKGKIERFVDSRRPAEREATARILGQPANAETESAARLSMAARVLQFMGQSFFVVPRRLLKAWPFTNACGDFTLLSRDDWFAMGGYPEWPIFSWHLDSILLYQADGAGLRKENFGSRAPVYHIEHGKGSGYTPEGAELLFASLVKRGVPFLSDADLRQVHSRISGQARSTRRPLFNESSWGMADLQLPEHVVSAK